MVEPETHGKQEEILIENIKASGVGSILVINKIDTIEKEKLLEVIADYSTMHEFDAVIPVSAKQGDGLEILIAELDSQLVEGCALYPEDMISDQPEKVIIAEYIREKAELYYDGPDPIGKTHVREGVVVRIINRPKFTAYKHKNWYFKALEGIVKVEAEAPDIEEAEEENIEC